VQFFFGAISTLMALVAYVFYFRGIWAGRTKPHAITWFIWASLTTIGFAAQVSDHGGPGSWVTGFSAAVCFLIFFTAIFRGERHILRGDWACLVGAVLSAGLWAITDNALMAVVLISFIDALGFVPTFRKSFHQPYAETMSTYTLSGIKFLLSLIALDNLSAVTVLYPASLVAANFVFVVMLMVRRKQLGRVGSSAVPAVSVFRPLSPVE